jgi:phage-related protein
MKKAAEAVGKALLYTATGLFILAVDAANAIISGVISAGAFVGKAVCSAVGAAWQGLAQIADWAIKGAKSAYAKAVTWGNSAWANFYTEAARVCKGTITACVAFIDGIKNGAKTLAYTLTGLAIATWKGIKTTFGPTVKSILEAAKDGAAFVKAGMVSIAKSVQNGAEVFRKTMKAGWDAAVNGTNVAIQAGKKYISDKEKALVDAYNNASKSIKNGFNSLYNLGKAFWESEECEFFFGDDTIFEDLDWSMDYNSDYDSDYDSDYVEFVY